MPRIIRSCSDREILHPLYSEILLYLARNRGLAPEQLASRDELQQLRSRHKPTLFFNLLENLLQLTDDPQLPIEFGRQIDLCAAGVIGQAVMSAATVGDSFMLIRRYYPLTGLFFDISSQRQQQQLFIRFDVTYDEIPDHVRCFLLEALVNSWAACYRVLSGKEIAYQRLTFDFNLLSPPSYYRRAFGCTTRSNGSCNLLVMDINLFKQHTVTANVVAHERAVAHCEAALLKYGSESSAAEQVIKQLRRETNLAAVNLDSLAAQMNVSSRTLNRRLQVESVKFQELLDDERKLRACRMLKNSPLTTDQIAEELGYSDASNFRRAFKKWTGACPKTFRQSPGY